MAGAGVEAEGWAGAGSAEAAASVVVESGRVVG